MSETWDAVVVGSGPNGLVAANRLADAGWSVLVLEAQATPGGAVRSDAEVRDGFVHDTFSAFYPLALASPAHAARNPPCSRCACWRCRVTARQNPTQRHTMPASNVF